MQDGYAELESRNKLVLEELNSTKKSLEDANKILALHPSTTKLNQMLSVGKSSHDSRGLGYIGSTSATPCTTNFVRAKDPRVEKPGTKGKEPMTTPKPAPKVSTQVASKIKKVPVCWTCGVKGHTYYNCWNCDYWYDYDYECSYAHKMPSKNSFKRKAQKKKNSTKVVKVEDKFEPCAITNVTSPKKC